MITVAKTVNFPAARTEQNNFGRNLQYLRTLGIGFTPQFAKALQGPEHSLSKFLLALDLESAIRCSPAQTALWLTELSVRFDAFAREHGETQVVRVMAKKLEPTERGRRFVLYFLEPSNGD